MDNGTTCTRPSSLSSKKTEEWILLDGTPASCVQIGIYHYFQDRGPIDLVVSGPNYGRNSTAVYSLSSGTLGGALEAAICRKKAIAMSYAYQSQTHNPDVIAGASRQSVKLVEYLYKNWGKNVDLYAVNIPLVADVENRKVMQTKILQNYWGSTSCYYEVEDNRDDPDEEEQKIREGEGNEENSNPEPIGTIHKHKHFRWAPDFAAVHNSEATSARGDDAWALKQFYTR